MSANLGLVNGVRITTGFLNTADDPAPGVVLASPSGSLVSAYPGQLGAKITLSDTEALALSKTTTGTLYRGVYRYVKFAASTATNARGQIVFWSDRANNVVTPDVADATITPLIAGITLMVNTKSYYGWIQVLGKASVKFKSSITKTTPAIGDLVIVDQAPTATGDTLADATALSSVTGKAIVGYTLEAAANSGVKLVELLRPDALA